MPEPPTPPGPPAPEPPAQPGPPVPEPPITPGTPVHERRAGQPAGPVDLDLPFTLDQAVATPAGATGRSPGGSPWAQPPQRPTSTGTVPTAGTEAAEPGSVTTIPAAAPTHVGDPGGPDVASAPGGPAERAGDEHRAPLERAPGGAEAAPPRLGPFPPAPGTPVHPPTPPYDGGGYPPPYGPPPLGTQPPVMPQHPQAVDPVPPVTGWYPPPWPQQGAPGPQQAPPGTTPGWQQPPPGVSPVPPQPAPTHPDPGWAPEARATPTAEEFARRRQAKPVDPVATMGVRAVVNRLGLVRLAPGRHEQELRRDIEMVRRNFGGLRQVTVVNPKGGAGKTVAILLLAMTFGQKRGGYVLAWDNNETQGTLGMRAQQDFHSRTVRDLLRDLGQFQGAHGRVGDQSQYVRSQGEGMFDVLASDESATGGEMLTAAAFGEIREVVSRFYKLIFVDTGNNVRAQNWQAAMDATDQLVVTMSGRNDSAETAARMLDHLEQSGRQRLVRQAVTVVSMPPSRKEIDLPAIQQHFAARTRAVLLAPYERLIDTGEPIRYGQLSSATRDAWLKIAAAVAEGL
ncbi:chromosome partitioning protein [Micromonospora rhizosphaerae]|uniref:MinD/ParA family ATP-binding protein n=1 Tax=Micromonospora rhizosphaerae TaxID=568872 RepID=UPI003CCB7E7C